MTTQKSIERLARFVGIENFEQRQAGAGMTWPFDPFTRLDDAMMVAEKIGGWDFRQVEPGIISASFTRNRFVSISETLVSISETLPEAITLAALAYLDATEKK